MTGQERTTDALEILHQEFVVGDPEMQDLIEEERANGQIARTLYTMRQRAGLTQRELAEKVGTSASAICRLEDADYEGHSLPMLRRIADAPGYEVHVTLEPKDQPAQQPVDHPRSWGLYPLSIQEQACDCQ